LTAVSAIGVLPSRGTSQSWLPASALQLARTTVEVHHRTGEHLPFGIGDFSVRTIFPSLPITTRLLSDRGTTSLPRFAVASTSCVPSTDSR
jgi:hypothetical protein